MSRFDFDYFVIGGGSGGIRSARVAAGYGARVAIAERSSWGGTCVNVGCIPKKLFTIAAHFATDFEEAVAFGWERTPARHDWKRLMEKKDQEIHRLADLYRTVLEDRHCTLFDAHATLVDAHTIDVAGSHVTADKILVATGGWPILADKPGVKEFAITSNEVFQLEEMPSSILIVGGGYVGMEFASIFHGLGARVVATCHSDALLKSFDVDLGRHLARELRKAGVDIRLQTDVVRIDKPKQRYEVTLTDGDILDVDCVLYAIGRKPNTHHLGVDAAGIACDDEQAIIVDAAYQTNVANIYAVGDVTDRFNLTPTAVAEGQALADRLFGGATDIATLNSVPSAVFSDPPIGAVGLTEQAARRAYGEIDVYKSEFRPLRHTVSGRNQTTLQKIVIDRASGTVLGCHMIGSDAPEIIQGFAVALNCRAIKAQFDTTVGLHPTSAEEFVSMRAKQD